MLKTFGFSVCGRGLWEGGDHAYVTDYPSAVTDTIFFQKDWKICINSVLKVDQKWYFNKHSNFNYLCISNNMAINIKKLTKTAVNMNSPHVLPPYQMKLKVEARSEPPLEEVCVFLYVCGGGTFPKAFQNRCHTGI